MVYHKCFKIAMFTISFLFQALAFQSLSQVEVYGKQNYKNVSEWDVLLFTQRWPSSACTEWHDKSSNNSCNLPLLQNMWTIHGIWPTKLGEGSKGSPSFCNKTNHFNSTVLQPIIGQLDVYWLNIENKTGHISLWKHEWQKHGTCAVSVPQLDSEYKYFSQGLTWIGNYNMGLVLQRAGILPNMTQRYTAQNFSDAVRSVLNVTCEIHCYVHKNYTYISEVRLCFNKSSLELINCTKNSSQTLVTDCSVKKPIFYQNGFSFYGENGKLWLSTWILNFYRLLQFLIWITV